MKWSPYFKVATVIVFILAIRSFLGEDKIEGYVLSIQSMLLATMSMITEIREEMKK